ncbi:MAG: hypothetical protein HGA85_03725 [Nanoarchaeota archaeon]|nr:hypothetical protein [Nanoarchaeota archaeon]
MADIPDFVWMVVGGLISLVSVFMGFIRPVEYSSFFKLMLAVGIGMVIYGYIKGKINQKPLQTRLEERRMQRQRGRGESEVDIDIDEYRRNPQLRQQAMQSQQGRAGYSQPQGYNGTPRAFPQQQPAQRPGYQQYPPMQAPSGAGAISTGAAGAPMPKSPIQSAYCSQCGTPLLKHHRYCPICGARV